MRFVTLGSPPPSLTFVTLHRLYIDACYWEHKSEVNHQMKLSANPSTSKSAPDKSSISASTSSSTAAPKDTKESKGKVTNISGRSRGKPNLTTKLGKNGKLTAAEWKNHFDNKLCMFCGLAGHIAKDCPKSTSQVSKGCTAATTPETKMEVSLRTKK